PQPIHQPANTPKDSPEESPAKGGSRSVRNDFGKMRNGKPRCNGRNNEPRKKASNNPETFPVPAFYFIIRHIKTSRSSAANEVVKDSVDYLHVLWHLAYRIVFITGIVISYKQP